MPASLRRVSCARASASTNKDISSLPSRLRASNQPSEHQLAVRVNNQTSVSNAHVTVPAFSPAQRASSVCPVRWLWLWAAAIRIRPVSVSASGSERGLNGSPGALLVFEQPGPVRPPWAEGQDARHDPQELHPRPHRLRLCSVYTALSRCSIRKHTFEFVFEDRDW